MLNTQNNIFEYITEQGANYKRPIPINDTWSWSMADHIKTSDLYDNSQLLTGKSEFKPVKNIIRPILNLQYRTEDVELTDVQIYVDEPENDHLSFLIKKYHDNIFVQENDLDTFFDELNVSRVKFGGGLSKKMTKGREVVPLQSIAFCDQTDILSGPIGIKHYYSPDQLLEMGDKGWGKAENGATISLEALIALSREEKKDNNVNNQTAQTPGRYIEVYEVHGNLPVKFANASDTSGKYETRIYICAFYQKKNSQEKQGVILYSALEKKSPFKFIKRGSGIYGRALDMGGAEELFEDQVWTNYSEIRKIDLLDAASKTILKAIGPNSSTIANKQKVKDMDNLEIVDIGEGSDLSQVDTFPRNMRLFDNYSAEKLEHAKDMGAAQDPIQGKEPSAGTPFSSLIEQVRQGMGLHEFRKKQFAKHIEEIYRDDYIPEIQREITNGFRFLSELSLEDLQYVSERMIDNLAEERKREVIFGGGVIYQEDVDIFKKLAREQFKKKGNKHFLEVLKGEFKNVKLGVKAVVAGKSKNLLMASDKITSIFRFVFSNPQGFMQVMQIPGMAKGFNQLLEFSGMNPVDFSGIEKLGQISQQSEQTEPIPMERIQPEMATA